MKQLVQDLMHGKMKIIEGPNPSKRENFVLCKILGMIPPLFTLLIDDWFKYGN